MLGYIGYGLPLSYLGPTLSFIAFSVTILIITALRDILSHQQIPW
jgi:hypothetical protein